jgi:hypothetical protein
MAQQRNEERERRRRCANLQRRAFMLAFHRSHSLPDGRSAVAVRGGQAAWRKRADAHPGGERGLALELAMRRHYPEAPNGAAYQLVKGSRK